jgi:putative redox protein
LQSPNGFTVDTVKKDLHSLTITKNFEDFVRVINLQFLSNHLHRFLILFRYALNEFEFYKHIMHVKVDYKGKLQFQAIARDHRVWSDQPLENGGEDAGMTPPEWFLASLGSCVGFYAVQYCQTRDLDTSGLTVEVSAEKTTDKPSRIDNIEIDLTLPLALEPKHQKGLEEAVNACLIKNTLTHSPQIATHLYTVSATLS